MTAKGLSLSKTTRGKLPSLPFGDMKEAILGSRYELSIVFVGERRAQRLNIEHRGKDYTPNVLSFPLTKTEGEIYLCPMVAKRQCKGYGMSERKYLLFLLIHGMLHLAGYQHGAKMDRMEQKLLARFAGK